MAANEANETCGFYPYAAKAMTREVPKYELPEKFHAASIASQMIKDEMALDGNPRLNLATFVTTYMEPECEELMTMASRKNFIDMDEYPATYKMEQRCVNMLARLYHAPLETPTSDAVGTACIGSSEAIMLATLAMKWKWKEARKAKGLPTDRPNMVFGANVQVCWIKACRYFEIDMNMPDVSPDSLVLTAERVRKAADENTIGVCPILGSTYNGEYEDVKAIHDVVMQLNKENGWDIPLHVDAASGGFVAPFATPELEWDFRLPGVKSINVSGHKYGLVYAGVGWVVFRNKRHLHNDLMFHVNYLGGDQASFTLNFSKSSANIVAQYYQLLRLGREGYTQIVRNCLSNAEFLREKLRETKRVVFVDKGHLPLVAFALNDATRSICSVFDMQDKLRNKGWTVPAYRCPNGAESLEIMRIVVKENFSCDLAGALVDDIQEAFRYFEANPRPKESRDKVKKAVQEAAGDAEHETVAMTKSRWHTLQLGVNAMHRFRGTRTTPVC